MADIQFDSAQHCLTVTLPERLDSKTTTPLWESLLSTQQQHRPKTLIVHANQMTYCNGAGLALLKKLSKLQKADQHSIDIQGLQTDIDALLTNLLEDDTPPPTPPTQPNWLETIGRRSMETLNTCQHNMGFIGEFCVIFLRQLRRMKTFRWQNFWYQIQEIGPKALPITALLGFIMGLILSFQAMVSLQKFGAVVYTINLVGVSLTRELGALMTAIILAGRTASAFAAEIGTMKINQEIDALTTLGIKPMQYLVLPRVLAGIIMTPLLTLYLIFFGFVGCFTVMAGQGYSFQIFCHQLFVSITFTDFWMGMLKALVFGILITSIGCINGLKTENHSVAVGHSTTKAVVSSIVMLAIADGILTIIFYIV